MVNEKRIDPVPEHFGTYDEAAEFWETHDTTDYSELFHTVEEGARKREIRVLLDASSIIDLEHGQPIPCAELDAWLRKQHARLVLTRTNVLEFSVSAVKTGDFLALRHQLQQIERLPVSYLREGGIYCSELKEAVAAFREGREFAAVDPYVKRWDETLYPS